MAWLTIFSEYSLPNTGYFGLLNKLMQMSKYGIFCTCISKEHLSLAYTVVSLEYQCIHVNRSV